MEKVLPWERINMDSKGNSLFYIAANKTSLIKNTFKNITTQNENSIFDLMTVGANIDGNTFENISLTGAGIFAMNLASPREGIDFKPSAYFDDNYFENMKIADVEGSIVQLNSKSLIFSASRNTITDSFDSYEKPLFSLKDTHCSPCLFQDNSFIFKKSQDGDSSLLYQISRCEGEVWIFDTQIDHKSSHLHFDSLLKIEDSPLILKEAES